LRHISYEEGPFLVGALWATAFAKGWSVSEVDFARQGPSRISLILGLSSAEEAHRMKVSDISLRKFAHVTHETGASFMRGPFMDFGDDPKMANIRDEYMFGPSLLIAPVTEQGRESREVYLPADLDWYNFWTNVVSEK
jgi:hypothetical protein